MPFQKGNSLAKGKGRPKGSKGIGYERVEEIRELAKQYTMPAFMKLVHILDAEDASYREQLTAAEIILERGWGKPEQHLEARIDIYAKLSDDELRAVVLKEVEILALEAAKDAEETQESLLEQEPEKPEGESS